MTVSGPYSASGRLRRWLDGLVGALYPPTCVLCGDPGAGRDLCRGCLRDLSWQEAACERCAKPLPEGQRLCGPCRHDPPPYLRTLAPLVYGPPLDHLILDLKFHRRLYLAPLLAGLVGERVTAPLPELLIPVPLHPARLRERGYNQALELARPLARRFGIPIDTRHCRRARPTAAQSTLHARERRRNLRGAFTVAGGLQVGHVAIVDDVVTTGSTVGELAQVLRKAGVERVDVWAVARAG